MERPWVLLKNGTRIFKIAIRLRDFHTKLICQNPMLRQIEWGLKKSRCITMNGSFASNYLFFWKFYFSSRTSYNELIWWINHLNVYIRNFGKHWSFIRWVLFPVIIFVVLVRKKKSPQWIKVSTLEKSLCNRYKSLHWIKVSALNKFFHGGLKSLHLIKVSTLNKSFYTG